MSNELSAAKKFFDEVLIDLMTERVMLGWGLSTGVQASSTRNMQASPSTAQVGLSRPVHEKWTKHKGDLANSKLISSIIPAYIPPLSGKNNWNSVPRDFEYPLVMMYLPKEIRAFHADQDKIPTLKFSDFNLNNMKVYKMLAPYKYLRRQRERI
jgi:hypothetical protein